MVTTLYLIRHGALEGGGPKRYNGSIDIPMSEEGVMQIKESSAFIGRLLATADPSKYLSYLKDIHGAAGATEEQKAKNWGATSGLSAVYCSDLSRAVKSAEIIAAPYGLAPVKMPELRERSFGIWEGMTFTEIKEQFPDEFEAWADNPVAHSPVGGESTLEVKERVVKALDEILTRHAGGNIAIIAHGGVNRILICHILGAPMENIFRVEQDYGAVNVVEFWDRYPVVKLLNGKQ
ncbi:MAG TPA: histidine phosphatase family protein [Candidatus Sulfobium mesophilum]|jgi:broad specificity phosphatase PhoE|nr:histidine phosphatase family protein [Candidatus Sulfobium mesophilum]